MFSTIRPFANQFSFNKKFLGCLVLFEIFYSKIVLDRAMFANIKKQQEVVMPVHSKLSDRMRDGEFLVSIQLDPPGSCEIGDFKESAELLKKAGARIVDINSSRRVSHDSIALASELSRVGFDTIPHVTLRDGSLSGIANQMLASYSWNGVRNFLIISGDPHDEERALFPSRGIFQANATEAIRIFDQCLRKSECAPNIEFAAAFNQNEREIATEIGHAKEKKEAGADFFMSQPVFSLVQATDLYNRRLSNVAPMIVGIWPLVSKKAVDRIWKNEVVGVKLPEHFYKEAMNVKDEDIEKWGIDKARDLICCIEESDLARGVYIVAPFKNPRLILPLVKEFC